MIERKATAKDVRDLRVEISAEQTTMPNQLDPGTSVDIHSLFHGWESGWVLVRPAFKCHDAAGDFWSYEVYRYPGREFAIPATQVRRSMNSF